MSVLQQVKDVVAMEIDQLHARLDKRIEKALAPVEKALVSLGGEAPKAKKPRVRRTKAQIAADKAMADAKAKKDEKPKSAGADVKKTFGAQAPAAPKPGM
jgi:hypothetical protein